VATRGVGNDASSTNLKDTLMTTLLRPLLGSALLLGTLLATGCEPSRSCADVAALDPGAGDGEYLLDIDGVLTPVYCSNMASTPTEYLPLPLNIDSAGPEFNFSTYGEGSNTTPGGVATWYTMVRLHLEPLSIDPADHTFSVNNGGIYWFGEDSVIDWVPYGTAGDCATPWSAGGRGNIDLSGTAFTVLPDQFAIAGHEAGGTIEQSGPQILDLTGGGFCGGASPRDGAIFLGL
jgi:hypothetical protein